MTDLPTLRDRLHETDPEAADAVEALIVAREALARVEFLAGYSERPSIASTARRALARIAALENKET